MKTRQTKLRKPRADKEVLPEYSTGGIIASTLIGAGTGAVGGGGVLSLPGALIGGTVGLIGGLFEHFKEKKLEKQEAKANLALGKASGAVQAGAGGSFNNYTDMWQAGMGGVVPYGKRTELEKNEVTDNGTMRRFNLPEHPNDSDIPLEPGTFVYSDNPTLKMPNGKTPAENAAVHIKTNNAAQKVLDDPNSSLLARKSAERNLKNINAAKEKIVAWQLENTKGKTNLRNTDGSEVATWGTILKGVGSFAKKNAGSLISGAATLAPVIFNGARSRQATEQLNPAEFQNPLAYQALDSMNNRQPDMNPALQATDASMAAANANLRSTATGRGQYAAGAVALANAGMTQKAGIYSQGSQVRNQYRGEYGQMQAGLGQKMADTNLLISDINSRNAAAGRNFGSAAMGQLSQWAQMQMLMKGQKANDDLIRKEMDPYLNMFKTYNRTGSVGGNISPAQGIYNIPGANAPINMGLRSMGVNTPSVTKLNPWE